MLIGNFDEHCERSAGNFLLVFCCKSSCLLAVNAWSESPIFKLRSLGRRKYYCLPHARLIFCVVATGNCNNTDKTRFHEWLDCFYSMIITENHPVFLLKERYSVK